MSKFLNQSGFLFIPEGTFLYYTEKLKEKFDNNQFKEIDFINNKKINKYNFGMIFMFLRS